MGARLIGAPAQLGDVAGALKSMATVGYISGAKAKERAGISQEVSGTTTIMSGDAASKRSLPRCANAPRLGSG